MGLHSKRSFLPLPVNIRHDWNLKKNYRITIRSCGTVHRNAIKNKLIQSRTFLKCYKDILLF
jgi:hypothetical protein